MYNVNLTTNFLKIWFVSFKKISQLFNIHYGGMLCWNDVKHLFKHYEGLRRSSLQTNNTNGVVLNKTYWYGSRLDLELMSIKVV